MPTAVVKGIVGVDGYKVVYEKVLMAWCGRSLTLAALVRLTFKVALCSYHMHETGRRRPVA